MREQYARRTLHLSKLLWREYISRAAGVDKNPNDIQCARAFETAFRGVQRETETTEQLVYVAPQSACIRLCRRMIVPRSCCSPEEVVQVGEYSAASSPKEGDDQAHRLGKEPWGNGQPTV
jgi:hypothetical protein